MTPEEVTIRITAERGDLFAQVFLPPAIVEFLATLAPDHPEAREFLRKWGYEDATVEGLDGKGTE